LKSKQKKTSALISIITPSYNSTHYIRETIVSVLGQTYPYWEMIIIDDYSDDDSRKIIEHYIKKDKRIKALYNTENIGAAQSRNRGIELSKGKYIAFLDSDDLWLSDKLEKQIQLMQDDNILLSYASYYTINETGKIMSTFPVQEKVTYFDMLKTSTIGTLTTVYNAEKLGKFYFEDIGHEDYVMKLQILKQIPYAKGLDEPLAKYRIHTQGLSSNKLKTALWQWHIYQKVEKLSFIKSIYYFIHYTYNGIFKYK
jgi:glycosyltransferase involved in cell wall biosynthesis